MAKGLQLVFLLLVCALYVEATSVTCEKKYSKKVTIKDGDSYTYATQSGTNYEAKSNCKITYKKHKSCSAMKFSCSAFAIDSPKVNCKKGDMMVVSTKEAKNKKYCQASGPDVTTTGNKMKVTFKSNGNTEDTGAVCTVECVSDEVTTPAPTEEPTTGNQTCGPEDCSIVCTAGLQCVEDDQIQCVMAPCCPRWSCVSVPPSLCPSERPDFGSLCQQIPADITCDYGQQECCGETFAETVMECMEGAWQGIAVETPCFALGGQPCPTTTAPTTCPMVMPNFGSSCQDDQDGLHCEYGQQECCGETFVDFVQECSQGAWQGYQMETPCQFDVTCPPPTTLPPSTCPSTRPEFGSDCQPAQSGLECEFGTQECCGLVSPEVIMVCDGADWQGYFVDTVCVLGLPCPSPPTTARTTLPNTVG